MAKTLVVKQSTGDKSPFLRGVLVQSLVNTGLPFDEAYRLAQTVKSEVRDTPEISSAELKKRVAALLDQQFGPDKYLAYATAPPARTSILVHTPARSAPFSIGILSHSLEVCAIPAETALRGARKVHASLLKSGHREVDHKSLRQIIYRCLRDHCSADTADRYLSWRKFENGAEPLIILIGGTTGSGKSTVSSDVAYRMDIGRIQSTDMMREIIRSYLTPQAVPALSYSSFEAWRGLPYPFKEGAPQQDIPVVEGFLSQFTTLKPALEAAISRAVEEKHDLIIEGIHVLPSELDLREARAKAIVVPLMLATREQASLRKQLKCRGHEKTARKASRYLEHLDAIWALQTYLLGNADKANIPIITNSNLEDTVREILNLISAKIMNRYPPRTNAND
jgi:2-phosphoglycerate kinase